MTLNKKEQNLAVIVAAAVVALGLYYGYYWWDGLRTDLVAQQGAARKQAHDDEVALKQGEKDRLNFEATQIRTLQPDRPDYAPAQRLIETTFGGGGLVFTNWGASGAPRPLPKNAEFQVAKFTATTNTTTARLARFLQYIESAKVPASIDGIDISATKPGVDNLRVVFTISTLLYAPRPTATGRGAATARATTGSATTSRPVNLTTPKSAPASGPSSQTLSKAEQAMILRREQEAARLATMPETPASAPVATGPKKTAAEIEADMIAKRQAQDAAASQPATTPGGSK